MNRTAMLLYPMIERFLKLQKSKKTLTFFSTDIFFSLKKFFFIKPCRDETYINFPFVFIKRMTHEMTSNTLMDSFAGDPLNVNSAEKSDIYG